MWSLSGLAACPVKIHPKVVNHSNPALYPSDRAGTLFIILYSMARAVTACEIRRFCGQNCKLPRSCVRPGLLERVVRRLAGLLVSHSVFAQLIAAGGNWT